MKTINKLIWTLAVLSTLSLAGCSGSDDDNSGNGGSGGNQGGDEPKDNKAELLIGRWYTETHESDNTQELYITEYKTDGTGWTTYAVTDKTFNNYNEWDSKWSYENSIITESFTDPLSGVPITEKYIIKSIGKYDFVLTYEELLATDNYHRIISTYNMKVGEAKDIQIDDAEFVPTSYSSDNLMVATVSNSGNVVALKRGKAYVSVKSAIGTAVIEIEVTDPDNYVDDTLPFLGEDINDIKKVYSEVVYTDSQEEDGTYLLNCRMLDKVMRDVGFYYKDGYVYQIINLIRNADINEVKKQFDKKYTYLGEVLDSYHYTTTKDYITVDIYLDPTLMSYSYKFKGENPFEDLDKNVRSIFNYKASEFSSLIGHELTEEEKANGELRLIIKDSSVFESATILFDSDTDTILYYIAYSKDGIEQELVEKWYKRNYSAGQSDYFQYTDASGNILIHIESDTDRNYVAIAYANNNR